MAVDPNLSLVAAQAQPDVATPIRQARQDANANELNAEQVLKAHLENMDAREQSRLRSTIVGAAQLQTYLDKQDVEGAHEFLVNRQRALQQRMANGENVDTQETDYALDKLRRGDIEGLYNDVSALSAAGRAYGMVGGTGLPASVQEWQYYNSLSPEDQKRWLTNKRAGSTMDLGGSQVRLGADGQPIAEYTKTLPPEKQPTNVRDAAAAGVVGTELGTAQAKLDAMNAQLPRLTEVVSKLSTLGKTATYTKAGVAANEVARQLGAKVPQGAVDRTEYISAVDNEVLPLLRQTFGAQFTVEEGNRLRVTLGDPDKTPEEKDAVLRSFINQKIGEIQSLQRQVENSGGAPSAGAPATQPVAGTVKVSNGTETYMISPEDLQQAIAEGFQQVQ